MERRDFFKRIAGLFAAAALPAVAPKDAAITIYGLKTSRVPLRIAGTTNIGDRMPSTIINVDVVRFKNAI